MELFIKGVTSCKSWSIKATSDSHSYVRTFNIFVLRNQSRLQEINSTLVEAFCWSTPKPYYTDLRAESKPDTHCLSVVDDGKVLLYLRGVGRDKRWVVYCLCHQLPVCPWHFYSPAWVLVSPSGKWWDWIGCSPSYLLTLKSSVKIGHVPLAMVLFLGQCSLFLYM